MPRISPNRIKNFLAFNGSSDFLTLPITPSVTGFNLAFWAIKRNHVGNARIIDCQDGGPSNGFTIVEENAGLPQASAVTNNGADTARIIKSIPNGRLFHMAVTHNGTELNVYINGVLAGTDTSAVYTATGQVLTIGRRAPSTLNYWNGKLGELIFHSTSTPWTQYQITNLYHNGIIPSGASYWLFNGNVLDGSDNGKNGTLTGGTYVPNAVYRVSPRFIGGSTRFDGSTSVIKMTTRPIYNLVNYSVSFWMNAVEQGDDKYFITNGSSVATAQFWGIDYKKPAGTNYNLRMFIRDDSNNPLVQNDITPQNLVHGRWYHVLITDAGGSLKCYVNGVYQGINLTYTRGTLTLDQTAFGALWRTAVVNNWNGKLSEVKIFNSAITSSQAQELYATGSVSYVSPVASYALYDQPFTYIDSIAGNNGTGTATTYSTDTPVQLASVVSDDKSSANGSAISPVGSVDTVTPNAGTVIGMAKISAYDGSTICTFYGADGTSDSWRFNVENNTGYPFLWTVNTSASGATNPKPLIQLPLNKWFYFALIQTVSGGVVTGKIYINGKLIGIGTRTSDVRACSRFAINSNSTVKTMAVIVYERELTPTEIRNYCFNRIVPSGAKINWPRQEGAGNINYDVSGNGANGTGGTLTWSSNTPSKKRKAVGENLVVNGDFSYVPVVNVATTTTNKFIDGTSGGASNNIFGWSFSKVGTASALFDVTNLSPSGKPSLKLSTLAVASLSAAYIPLKGFSVATNDNGVLSIPVTPNTSYTLSFLMKTNLVSGVSDDGAGILCSCSTGGGGATFSAYPISIFGTSGWTLYTDTFTTSATSRSIQVSPRIEGRTGTGTLIMDAWFADIKLQKTTPPVRSNPV